MQISLDQQILEAVPTFKIGMNHYTKITVSESPQMIKGRLQLFQEQLFFEFDEKNIADYPSIKEWRHIWKTFGADPNRYRPSIEALLKRIQKQNYISPINSAVDLNNFFSLQYKIPTGIYDTNFIESDIQITVGTNETNYEGLNGRENRLKGLIVSTDSKGPFGSPYVDSKRTAVSSHTVEAIQLFFLRPTMEITEAQELLQAAGNMFSSIHGGDVSTNLLHLNEPYIKVKP